MQQPPKYDTAQDDPEPVYEKGYPSYDAVNRDNDPEPERYYEWMLWKMRKEDEADKRRERSRSVGVDSNQE